MQVYQKFKSTIQFQSIVGENGLGAITEPAPVFEHCLLTHHWSPSGSMAAALAVSSLLLGCGRVNFMTQSFFLTVNYASSHSFPTFFFSNSPCLFVIVCLYVCASASLQPIREGEKSVGKKWWWVWFCVPLSSGVCFSISLCFLFSVLVSLSLRIFLSCPVVGQADHLGRYLRWFASHSPCLKADY